MKRVFIAIKVELSSQLAQVFDQLKQKLADENIRWAPIQYLHITLSFIGDVSDEQLKRINEMLQQLCGRHGAFSFQLKNLAYFKRRGNPAVVFFDVDRTETLVEFTSQLKAGLKESGIPSNPNFNPHLTLGRLKNLKHQTAFYETLDRMKETPAQKVDVKQVILFESVLKQTGPEYHVLGEFYFS